MKRTLAHKLFKANSGSISTVENLARALSLQISDFESFWEIPESQRYKPLEKPKASGGVRVVYNPCREARLLQRRINTRIFSNPHIIKWPPYLYGSIPSSPDKENENRSRDYVSCARLHCQAKSILKIDIKDFFDNIHESLVYDIFSDVLKYPEEVSQVLTRICTHNSRLVQGALTSSYLAMLSLYKFEDELNLRLSRKNLVYTRFVDDITVSSKVANYDFSYAYKIIEDMLSASDFPVNTQKTTIQYASSSPLTVHGLRVCFKEPRLPSNEINNIRAAVRELEIVSREKFFRQKYAYRLSFNRCLGRVNKLARVHHPQHGKLVRKMAKIRPLPSPREVEYVKAAISFLEIEHEEKKEEYHYRKRFYRLNERLNIVKRLYPSLARDLRKRLSNIQPVYD